MVVGRNKPTKSEEEQTVEDVRNVEGGTNRAWDARASGLFRFMPRWGAKPQGRCWKVGRSQGRTAGRRAGNSNTLEGSEAHERIPPQTQVGGERRPEEDHEDAPETVNVEVGAENPMSPLLGRRHTLKRTPSP